MPKHSKKPPQYKLHHKHHYKSSGLAKKRLKWARSVSPGFQVEKPFVGKRYPMGKMGY